jgi:hypothetical protein
MITFGDRIVCHPQSGLKEIEKHLPPHQEFRFDRRLKFRVNKGPLDYTKAEAKAEA